MIGLGLDKYFRPLYGFNYPGVKTLFIIVSYKTPCSTVHVNANQIHANQIHAMHEVVPPMQIMKIR